jgi:hypothetical protein
MKKLPIPTIDTPTLTQLRLYILQLKSDSKPLWGTMNSSEMCKHCNNFIRLYLGELKVAMPIRLLARIFGSLFIKKLLSKSPKETPKNLNTLPAIRVKKEDLDFDTERSELLDSLTKIETISGIIKHPLYGPMEAEDILSLIRHHTAHHLNQFNLLPN